MNAPKSNSWVIVSKKTGQPVLETFNKQFADAINREKYEVLTSLEWLQRFNQSVRNGGLVDPETETPDGSTYDGPRPEYRNDYAGIIK